MNKNSCLRSALHSSNRPVQIDQKSQFWTIQQVPTIISHKRDEAEQNYYRRLFRISIYQQYSTDFSHMLINDSLKKIAKTEHLHIGTDIRKTTKSDADVKRKRKSLARKPSRKTCVDVKRVENNKVGWVMFSDLTIHRGRSHLAPNAKALSFEQYYIRHSSTDLGRVWSVRSINRFSAGNWGNSWVSDISGI